MKPVSSTSHDGRPADAIAASESDESRDACILLSEYPDAAILVRPDGTVVNSNPRAASLDGLIVDNVLSDEVQALVMRAHDNGSVTTGPAVLHGSGGMIALEATVIPDVQGGSLLVLVHDLTLERNLRAALVESRQRYKDLVEVSSDFYWEVGHDGCYAFVSPTGALGYPPEELVGRRPEDFVVGGLELAGLPFHAETSMEEVEVWMRRSNGGMACVMVSSLPLMDQSGLVQGARGICRDVTAEREREAALSRATHREQVLGYIVNTIRDVVEPESMLDTAAAATSRALGGLGCRILRRVEEHFIIAASHGNMDALARIDDAVILEALDSETGYCEREHDGWHALCAPTRYRKLSNGAIGLWKQDPWTDDERILLTDIANQVGVAIEQLSNHERIVNLSRTDGLTGLLNRRAFFEEELPRRLARLQRSGHQAALFYVDLDNFKQVNDTFGHAQGDDVLHKLRDMLLEHSRPGDEVARLGGDEFAVWLDGVDESVAVNRAASLIRHATEQLGCYSATKEHPLGLSVGVALYNPRSTETLTELLVRADQAMYFAKRNGKGNYALAPHWEEKPLIGKKNE